MYMWCKVSSFIWESYEKAKFVTLGVVIFLLRLQEELEIYWSLLEVIINSLIPGINISLLRFISSHDYVVPEIPPLAGELLLKHTPLKNISCKYSFHILWLTDPPDLLVFPFPSMEGGWLGQWGVWAISSTYTMGVVLYSHVFLGNHPLDRIPAEHRHYP